MGNKNLYANARPNQFVQRLCGRLKQRFRSKNESVIPTRISYNGHIVEITTKRDTIKVSKLIINALAQEVLTVEKEHPKEAIGEINRLIAIDCATRYFLRVSKTSENYRIRIS